MRKKHTEKQCTEPWVKWERMRFPKIPVDLEKELKAEAETDEDLTKTIPQLVCDFNLEITKLPQMDKEDRILLTAQKYMVAMMAKVAMSNDRMTWAMIGITAMILILTAVLVFKG